MHLIEQIQSELRDIEISRTKIRRFGWLIGGVFITFGVYALFVSGMDFWWTLPIGCIIVACSLCMPQLLAWPYKIWMSVGTIIGFFLSRLVLIIIFAIAMVPTAVLMRLFHRDTLKRTFDKTALSYWMSYIQPIITYGKTADHL